MRQKNLNNRFYSEPANISCTPSSIIDIHLEFHDVVKSNNHIISKNWYSKFNSLLTLCSYEPSLEKSPPILVVGEKASQRLLFGNAWADNVIDQETTPDPELEMLSCQAYYQAFKANISEPEICFASVNNGVENKQVCYYRTVAHVKSRKGFSFFAYFGTLKDHPFQ